jgi:hypothetical protein
MGQAYFYNLTEFSTQLTLNDFVPGETIAKVPSTAPYTPNASATTYSRYKTSEPQKNQFGITNRVACMFDQGSGGSLAATIDIDFAVYNETQDILIYIYMNAFVVACLSDNNAYLGKNGSTIRVAPDSPSKL